MIGIYKITDHKTGKIYIGQSIHIKRRIKEHFNGFSKQDVTSVDYQITQRKEDFSYEILIECNVDELNQYEEYFIQLFNCIAPYGYNKTSGGTAPMFIENKLNYADVQNIYKLLIENQISQKEISKMYNVKEHTISAINLGYAKVLPGYTFPLRKEKRLGRPPKQELIDELYNSSTLTALLNKYDITHKTFVQWCNDYKISHYFSDYKKPEPQVHIIKDNSLEIRVLQYDLNGQLVRIFQNRREAFRITHDSKISAVLKGERSQSKGYIYKYEEQPNFLDMSQIKVEQRDLDGNVVAIYRNLREATQKTHISCIKEACDGKRKTRAGFYWRYII